MDSNPYLSHNMNLTERTRKLNSSLNDKNEPLKTNYHGQNSYAEMDNEYHTLLNQKSVKSKSAIINLTSKELKKEYEKKKYFFKKQNKINIYIIYYKCLKFNN